MIRSLKAQNFRCFRELDLPDPRRINLVVGKNAAGKTALLEAIRLALGATPQIAWTLTQYRAAGFYGSPMSREMFESVWNPFFFNLDPKNQIFTECDNGSGHKASLRMFYDVKKSVTPVLQAAQSSGALLETIIPVAFERINFMGEASTFYASLGQQGQLALDPAPELVPGTEFFISTLNYNTQAAAAWFSQLSLQSREADLVNTVREEFKPFIENLSVLSPNQFGNVYATLPYLKNKLPLTLVSSGITKFFTLLAAIMSRGRGVVLIDEIENGIYYDRFESLWKILHGFAKQYDVQVFASTHSRECLRALLPAIEGNEEDFCLIRTEHEREQNVALHFSGHKLESAIAQHVELR